MSQILKLIFKANKKKLKIFFLIFFLYINIRKKKQFFFCKFNQKRKEKLRKETKNIKIFLKKKKSKRSKKA